jgi:hypothetical protein
VRVPCASLEASVSKSEKRDACVWQKRPMETNPTDLRCTTLALCPVTREREASARVSRPRGTGSVGDSVGEGRTPSSFPYFFAVCLPLLLLPLPLFLLPLAPLQLLPALDIARVTEGVLVPINNTLSLLPALDIVTGEASAWLKQEHIIALPQSLVVVQTDAKDVLLCPRLRYRLLTLCPAAY